MNRSRGKHRDPLEGAWFFEEVGGAGKPRRFRACQVSPTPPDDSDFTISAHNLAAWVSEPWSRPSLARSGHPPRYTTAATLTAGIGHDGQRSTCPGARTEVAEPEVSRYRAV
nr:hypothetical protein [Mycobacterium leprae]